MQSCCTWSAMNYGCSMSKRKEVTSTFPRLLMEVFAVLQEKKVKKKIRKNLKEKSFENVHIKSNILINHLHVLLNILIMWMFTLCMILAEYFMHKTCTIWSFITDFYRILFTCRTPSIM